MGDPGMVVSNTATVANGLSVFTVTCWFSVDNTGYPPSNYRALICKVNSTGVGNTGIGWAIRTGTPADGTGSKIGAFILDGTNWSDKNLVLTLRGPVSTAQP